MAQRLPSIVSDGEFYAAVRFGDQRDLDAALPQQGHSVPQRVIDQFGRDPHERVAKAFGALACDLYHITDCLVGRCTRGNQILCERLQLCVKRLGSIRRHEWLITPFGCAHRMVQLISD